jgi:hypothetical protein
MTARAAFLSKLIALATLRAGTMARATTPTPKTTKTA